MQQIGRDQRAEAVGDDHGRTVIGTLRVVRVFLRGDVAEQRDVTFGNAGARSVVEGGSAKVAIDVEQNVKRGAAVAIDDSGDGGTGEGKPAPDKVKQFERSGDETI